MTTTIPTPTAQRDTARKIVVAAFDKYQDRFDLINYLTTLLDVHFVKGDHTKANIKAIVSYVADLFGEPVDSLFSDRKRERVNARCVVYQLCAVHFGMKPAKIGEMFGRDRTTVLHALSLYDDLVKFEKGFRTRAVMATEFTEKLLLTHKTQ